MELIENRTFEEISVGLGWEWRPLEPKVTVSEYAC